MWTIWFDITEEGNVQCLQIIVICLVCVCERPISEFCGQHWSILVKCNSVYYSLTSVASPKGL